jgi:hypothetical protein
MLNLKLCGQINSIVGVGKWSVLGGCFCPGGVLSRGHFVRDSFASFPLCDEVTLLV